MGWKNCQAGFEALHSSSVHTSSFIITLNVDVTAHFFLDNMAGFFYLPARGQDVTKLHRMNPLQDLLSPPSTPFPLTPRAGTQGNWQVKVECPLQPTPPWSFSFQILCAWYICPCFHGGGLVKQRIWGGPYWAWPCSRPVISCSPHGWAYNTGSCFPRLAWPCFSRPVCFGCRSPSSLVLNPGVISGSAAQFPFQGLMKHSSGTLHLTHCFLCHPTVGSTAVPTTSLGCSWEETERAFNPQAYHHGLRRVGFFAVVVFCVVFFFYWLLVFLFYFFFSFSRKLSALAPSLLKEVSFHLADTQTHTLDNSHPRQQCYNKDHSILRRTRQIAKCHITTPIIKGPYAPISSAQLQTTEWLCFSQWQAVWHGSHPPSKCLCLFACYLTQAGLSRHLLTPCVWVAT